MNQTKNKEQKKKTQKTDNRKKLVVIPYISKISEQVAKVFKQHGVSTAMRPHSKLRNHVVHAKDKIPKEKATGVVYQIPCKNCNMVYIGETSRALATRIQEHKDDVRRNAKKQYTRATRKESETEYNKSAITDHMNTHNHIADWNNVKIVARENNKQARWIKEALAIKRHGNTMNRDEGNKTISNIYHSLLTNSSDVTPEQRSRTSALRIVPEQRN